MWCYTHEYYLHAENNVETNLVIDLCAKDGWILEYAVDTHYLLLVRQEAWAKGGHSLLGYQMQVQKI